MEIGSTGGLSGEAFLGSCQSRREAPQRWLRNQQEEKFSRLREEQVQPGMLKKAREPACSCSPVTEGEKIRSQGQGRSRGKIRQDLVGVSKDLGFRSELGSPLKNREYQSDMI